MKQIFNIPRTAMEVFNMLPEGTRCEVIDNTVYLLPTPTTKHQEIIGDIFFLLKQSINQSKTGRLFISPLDVYLDDELAVVQPDIFVLRSEKLHLAQWKGVVGAPNLVIEVLSIDKQRDRDIKFNLYQKNLVFEYIIIDPETKEVWHYLLKGNLYEQVESKNGQLNIRSISAAFVF